MRFAEATPPKRSRPIDRYLPFLKQQWEAGCDNAPKLHEQLKELGFTGSVFMVRRQLGRWRKASGVRALHGPRPVVAASQMIRPSARRIAWLALGHVAQPTAEDQAILKLLCQRWPELQESAELARQFASLLKEHDPDSLEAWVQLAEGAGIDPEVRRFGQGLKQDWAAVIEAIKLPWSQSQVEGQINRLKLIKRQMYGRVASTCCGHACCTGNRREGGSKQNPRQSVSSARPTPKSRQPLAGDCSGFAVRCVGRSRRGRP